MLRALPYAAALSDRRRAGERVGLLVVSVHDWDAGKWFEAKPEVGRVVLPADVAVNAADWSICLALDCLVCGAAVDGTFYGVCDALKRCGAASVWAEMNDGICLIEPVGRRWVVIDGPYRLNKLGAALRKHRETAMMLGLGFYGSRVFNAARMALIDNVAGLADLLKSGQGSAA